MRPRSFFVNLTSTQQRYQNDVFFSSLDFNRLVPKLNKHFLNINRRCLSNSITEAISILCSPYGRHLAHIDEWHGMHQLENPESLANIELDSRKKFLQQASELQNEIQNEIAEVTRTLSTTICENENRTESFQQEVDKFGFVELVYYHNDNRYVDNQYVVVIDFFVVLELS